MSMPIVSIVGRPNVGKSSLLNCLAGRRISIVDPTPGVTRDRISTPIALGDEDDSPWVEVVDTGGMGIEDADRLTDDVETQIRFGIDAAAVIIFMVDAREGLAVLDRHVAEKLRRQKMPVILVANKVDDDKVISEVGELTRLGFGEPLCISATHHHNIRELLEKITEIVEHLPASQPTSADMKLAIVGKRNAGKSTIINALAGENRVIVSETPGTTRDSVDVHVKMGERNFTLIDTAGVKRRGKLASDVEYYSQHRAMRSVRRADVVGLVIDASLPVSQTDKNLAGIIADEFKPTLIIVNKWDLAKDNATPEAYAEYFAKTFPELSYAPISMTTATEKINLKGTVKLAEELMKQSQTRVTTGKLNVLIQEILAKRGPSHPRGTKPPKILYASQVSTQPPTIVCIVNDTRSFEQNYQRFLVNQFQENLPFGEVPVRVLFRSRRGDPKV
ncbi:MAG: ribosome biogenesis GTPase Der [Phycisphaerae bacterium]|nr:ribosome biogenesis GTPase Der [Phycisphaerae bacterium]